MRIIERAGCVQLRQRGSHANVRCPEGCQTMIPVHRGRTSRPARCEQSNVPSNPASERMAAMTTTKTYTAV